MPMIAGPIAALAVALGVPAAAAAAIGSAVVTGLEIGAVVATALIGQPKLDTGAPVAFKADINAGVPYVVGRTGTGGNIVFVDTSNDGKNKSLLYIVVLSHGPVTSIEQFSENNIPVTFDPSTGDVTHVALNWRGAWSGSTNYRINDGVSYSGTNYIAIAESFNNTPPNVNYWATAPSSPSTAIIGNMFMYYTLGAQPDSAVYAGATFPEWTSAHKLSGLAVASWTLNYNTKAYGAGTPKPIWVVNGPAVYDPRLDSTYPGGSGSQRWNDETTWAFSENPYLHALAWIIGRKNNGVKVLGLGIPIGAIDVAAYVNGANVADTNVWKAGGVVSSTDSKWQVLTAILQAGGGVPTRLGAKISCIVNTPVTSIATLTTADTVGPSSIQFTVKRADRINRVIPSYRAENINWTMAPAAAIDVSGYDTADGGKRTKAIDYPMVQQVKQVSQLAAYAIYDSREAKPFVIPVKPQWMGLQPGDAITLNDPEWGLSSQLCLITGRKIDPVAGYATLTLQTETAAKHAAALAVTGSTTFPPALRTIDISAPGAPGAGVWTAAGTTLTDGTSQGPALVVTGASDNPSAQSIVVEYSVAGAGVYNHVVAGPGATQITIPGVQPNTSYDVQVSYMVLGVQSAATVATSSPATSGAGATFNQIVNFGPTNDTGSYTYTGGSGTWTDATSIHIGAVGKTTVSYYLALTASWLVANSTDHLLWQIVARDHGTGSNPVVVTSGNVAPVSFSGVHGGANVPLIAVSTLIPTTGVVSDKDLVVQFKNNTSANGLTFGDSSPGTTGATVFSGMFLG